MKIEEFEELKKVRSDEDVILVDQLTDKADRTLIYGYTPDRATWHLYLMGEAFHLKISDGPDVQNYYYGESIPIDETTPTKRTYPAKSDFEFCRLLVKAGHHISFTTYIDDDRPPRKDPFHGDT